MFYLRGEELLVHSNCCCCCCTASATATLCFAFTHTHTLPRLLAHTHLLTHTSSRMRSPSSVLIPPSLPVSPLLSLRWSLPPFIICCLLYIPLSAQAFPSLSQYLLASLCSFFAAKEAAEIRKEIANRSWIISLSIPPSHAHLSSFACFLSVFPHPLALGVCFE